MAHKIGAAWMSGFATAGAFKVVFEGDWLRVLFLTFAAIACLAISYRANKEPFQ